VQSSSWGRHRTIPARWTCEGILVDAGDAQAAARTLEFGEALHRAGVAAPLAIRTSPALAERALRGAARLVVPIEGETPDPLLKFSAQATARAGLPLEWSLQGAPERLLGLVDRVVEAAAGVGLEAWLVSVMSPLPVHAVRLVAARLRARAVDVPIVLRQRRSQNLSDEAALLHAAIDLGAPLCDGIGDAIALSGFGSPDRALTLAYRILQGARLRTSWTEFISCPSCGRTLFDLEQTTARIKARTGHLRGVKIAVMGCIVNGPGEMADADFGYVGSGPGRVNLYVGKECVLRNVPQDGADDRLIDLIRERGMWVEA
jgi:(E)-4-hydroxy-3-methylbut-2-enyl-diphosphate synthase